MCVCLCMLLDYKKTLKTFYSNVFGVSHVSFYLGFKLMILTFVSVIETNLTQTNNCSFSVDDGHINKNLSKK